MKMSKLICILGLILSLSFAASAEETKRKAKILQIRGNVEVMLLRQRQWIPARRTMLLSEGDIIKTGRNSWAVLNLDGLAETATIEIEENSQVMLSELTKDERKNTQDTLLDLGIGKILIKARKLHSPDSKFEVKTPTSVVGVRGTTFSVTVESLE